MSRGISVRVAVLDDLPTVVELRLALLREYGDHELYRDLHPDAARRAYDLYRAQLESSFESIFLAERGASAVGILRCVDTPGSPLLLPDRFCYVSSVYVRPAARRHGVLRMLLDAADNWCAERGLTEMRLHNSAAARVAARTWGELGFDVVEEVRRRVIPSGRTEHAAAGAPANAY
ncbi:MAG: GNAT family N-acetyltransferase [Gemmatimonadaceae bacterium]